MLSLCPVLSLLPAPLSAPLSPASARSAALRSLSRAPQARTAHTPHPTPSELPTADTARASEAGLTTPELRLYRPTT